MLDAYRLRATTALALGTLFSSACIITTSETEDDTSVITEGTDGGGSDSAPATSAGTLPDPDDTGPVDTGVDPPEGDCTENLVLDPGFEAGSPSTAWQEDSMLFGSPICDSSCTDMPGAVPHSGEYWAWFGGLADSADFATVAQPIVVPAGDVAVITFWFQIRSGSGTGNDVFALTIDDTQVFFAADTDMGQYSEYTQVEVDVTDFADGQEHMFYFDADIAGAGLTSYFLDDVALVSCTDAAADSSGDGSTGAATTTTGVDSSGDGATDSGTGATDSGTDGSTGATGTTGGM